MSKESNPGKEKLNKLREKLETGTFSKVEMSSEEAHQEAFFAVRKTGELDPKVLEDFQKRLHEAGPEGPGLDE